MDMSTEIEIRHAQETDVKEIVRLIKEAGQGLEHRDWFVPDDETFIRQHMRHGSGSFVLAADCRETEESRKELAGYLIVRCPQKDDDNLGRVLQNQERMPDESMMDRVFHMESAAVSKKYSGRHIQYRLMAAAEEELKNTKGSPVWLCGTVHPDNKKSLHTFLRLGYEIDATVKKYGGLDRHIMCKYC
ncbi:GNAT family N-acetyltransferase [Clostridium sp. AM58-1XD]|uniref:GNAT family N-acetyltransferase n=1 Tax=Clostridium sp. AM58-1XD TaxID=2292307 RepID=UPI000E496CBD|nr:GNAT family N-acetyltransferase [Clostridium sp. AM58-1XD]RGY96655.1 N-acetyltransferase [Clostridium sp. AM58-1XD]